MSAQFLFNQHVPKLGRVVLSCLKPKILIDNIFLLQIISSVFQLYRSQFVNVNINGMFQGSATEM